MNRYEWYICPKCGKKLFKINKKSIVRDIKVWCKNCKEEKEINIEPKSQQSN